MRRLPTLHLRALAVSSFCLIIPLGPFLVELSLKRSPQSLRPRQDLHSIVSRKALSPTLRSPDASLRFSPDGKYLLFQDPSGVIVMSKDPLNIVLRVSTEDIYPAQFSLDSRNITIVSRALNFARWRLPDGQKTDHGSLPIEDGCLDGQLSPNGEIFACLKVNFKLALYEVSNQKVVFENSILGTHSPPPGHIGGPSPVIFMNYVWLDFESPFARPFGLVRTNTAMPNPSHILSHSAIHFSPDRKVLIAGSFQDALGLEMDSNKKFDLSDALKKALHGALDLQSSERAVAVETGSKGEGEILSLRDGKVLSHPVFMADPIQIATNSRYAILYSSGADGRTACAFDLEQNHLVEVPPSASLDIYGEEVAFTTSVGRRPLSRRGTPLVG
jgi:hypothetical protein